MVCYRLFLYQAFFVVNTSWIFVVADCKAILVHLNIRMCKYTIVWLKTYFYTIKRVCHYRASFPRFRYHSVCTQCVWSVHVSVCSVCVGVVCVWKVCMSVSVGICGVSLWSVTSAWGMYLWCFWVKCVHVCVKGFTSVWSVCLESVHICVDCVHLWSVCELLSVPGVECVPVWCVCVECVQLYVCGMECVD